MATVIPAARGDQSAPHTSPVQLKPDTPEAEAYRRLQAMYRRQATIVKRTCGGDCIRDVDVRLTQTLEPLDALPTEIDGHPTWNVSVFSQITETDYDASEAAPLGVMLTRPFSGKLLLATIRRIALELERRADALESAMKTDPAKWKPLPSLQQMLKPRRARRPAAKSPKGIAARKSASRAKGGAA